MVAMSQKTGRDDGASSAGLREGPCEFPHQVLLEEGGVRAVGEEEPQ